MTPVKIWSDAKMTSLFLFAIKMRTAFSVAGVIGITFIRMPWASGFARVAAATFGVSCYPVFL